MALIEPGVCSGSDLYFQTPSENARRLLYYTTSCGSFFTDYAYRIERENYHNYMIFFVKSGRLSVTNEGKTTVAHAGQVGFMNCHKPHEYHTIGNTEFYWIHLDGANTADFYQHICELYGGFIFDFPQADVICDMILQIVYRYRNDQAPGEAALSHLLYTLLLALISPGTARSMEQDAEDHSPVGAAIAFIRKHYAEPVSLDDMAAAANMSRYHFSRQFKNSCGFSPYEYLILTRINRAKHLLVSSTKPIKVIAQEVGYGSEAAFTNAFASRVGVSPGLFRKYPG